MEVHLNNSNTTLEYKLFRKTIFFIIITIVFLIITNALVTKLLISFIIEIIMLVVAFLFYWLLEKGHRVSKLSPALVIILFIMADVGILNTAGLSVGNVVVYLLIVIVMNSLIPLRLRSTFGILAFLNIIVLAVLEYKLKLRTHLTDYDSYMINKDVFILIGFSICYYLTYYLREKYEEERALNILQNAELLEKNLKIEAQNAEQKNLMAILAHDLKAPFDKMIGCSRMLEKISELSEEQKKLIDILTSIAFSGRDFVAQILDLSNFEQSEYQPKTSVITLSDFVQSIIDDYEGQADSKKMIIKLTEQQEDLKVITDKNLLGRILDNLLSNAIKFSKENKNVEIKIGSNNQDFSISIKDQGPGFTDKDKTMIYRKFQKLSAQPMGDENSTGLGLSIVKMLTEMLNGEIELISEADKGAEFILTFPKAPEVGLNISSNISE